MPSPLLNLPAPPRTRFFQAGTNIPVLPAYLYGDYKSTVLSMVPALYWPLDAGSGATDQSGNGRNGTAGAGAFIGGYSGSPVRNETTSTDFDGVDDYIDSTYASAEPSTVHTFTTWFQRDTNDTFDSIFNHSVTGSPFIYFGQYANYIACRTYGAPDVYNIIADPVSMGAWHHLAVVIDTGAHTITGYLDGALTLAPETINSITSGALLQVSGEHPFDGKMAHVAVFERALSAAEVSTLYNGAAGPPLLSSGRASTSLALIAPTPAYIQGGGYKAAVNGMGPALYWPLTAGDVSGSTIYDRSGNSRDGVIWNGTGGGESDSPITGETTSTNFDHSDDYVSDYPGLYSPYVNGTTRTFAGWFKRDNTSAYHTLIGSFSSSGTPARIVFDNTGSGDLQWQTNVFGGVATWAGAAPGSGAWWHFALIVTQGTGAELYINGSSLGTRTLTDAYSDPDEFTLGYASGNLWDGEMAHIAIFERALSAAEISALYDLHNYPPIFATGVSTASANVTVPAIIPLGTANGISTTSLALTATARLILATAAATSTASLSLTAQTRIPLGTAAGVSTTSLALTAPTKIVLATAAGISTASLTVIAPRLVPLDTAAATSTTSLALTVPAPIPLATAAGVSSTSLSITAPTKIVLATSAGISTTSLALTAQTKIPLATAAGVSTTSLALTATARVALGTAAATSTTSLALRAPTKIPLGTAAATSTTSISVVAGPGVIGNITATGTSSTSLSLTAPTKITLATAAGTSSTSLALTVPARITLDTANASSAATLVLTALTGIPLGTVTVTSSASLIVTTPSLAVFVSLDTAHGISTTSIEIDTHLIVPPEPEPGVYDFTIRRILTQYPAGTEVGVWAGEPDVYDNYGMRRLPPIDPVATATVEGDPFTITGLPEGDYFAIGTFQRKVRPRGDPDFETVLQTISFHVP